MTRTQIVELNTLINCLHEANRAGERELTIHMLKQLQKQAPELVEALEVVAV